MSYKWDDSFDFAFREMIKLEWRPIEAFLLAFKPELGTSKGDAFNIFVAVHPSRRPDAEKVIEGCKHSGRHRIAMSVRDDASLPPEVFHLQFTDENYYRRVRAREEAAMIAKAAE